MSKNDSVQGTYKLDDPHSLRRNRAASSSISKHFHHVTGILCELEQTFNHLFSQILYFTWYLLVPHWGLLYPADRPMMGRKESLSARRRQN